MTAIAASLKKEKETKLEGNYTLYYSLAVIAALIIIFLIVYAFKHNTRSVEGKEKAEKAEKKIEKTQAKEKELKEKKKESFLEELEQRFKK